MMCGDFETALALLDRSLQTPSGVTIQELRLDPVWDALRGDPRFQRMLHKIREETLTTILAATAQEESCLSLCAWL